MGGQNTTPKVDELEMLEAEIQKNIIVVFSGTRCIWCHRLRDLLECNNLLPLTHTILLDKHPQGQEFAHGLNRKTGQRTIPNVFIGGVHVGGFTEVNQLITSGDMKRMIDAAVSRRTV